MTSLSTDTNTDVRSDIDRRPPGWPVITQLANRYVLYMVRIPATVIPTIIMPVFFVIAFSGSFGSVASLPGFGTDNILNWMAPFAILQGASFAGLGASFGVARDLETGFYDRLLLSPVSRVHLLAGPLWFTANRALLPVAVVLPVAYLGGARIRGGILGFVTLVVSAIGIALVAGLWGIGIAYRTRTQRSGAFAQVGIFVAMFLSIGMVPLAAMDGWLHAVAKVNPVTNILRLGRQGFLGDVTWAATWPGLVAIGALLAVFVAFAWRGMQKLTP